MKLYDLIIVGSGPAGLTAAIYAARYHLNFLVIGRIPGGTIFEAQKVCNFPTQNNITGFELTQKLVGHFKELGGEVEQGMVTEIRKENEEFFVKTNKTEYKIKKIILATGREKKKLGVKGEDEFLKRGVSYCAICDADFYKGRTTAVIGGGNSAIATALLLAEYAKKVYIIYRRDKFHRVEPWRLKHLEENKKIEIIFNSDVTEIYGGKSVEGVKLINGNSLKIDGIFIETGFVPDKTFSDQLNLKTDDGCIIVDKMQRTNVGGVFAAGDITNNFLKQVITACAEGAIAASSVFDEIKLERN